jgi:hypothetical protein
MTLHRVNQSAGAGLNILESRGLEKTTQHPSVGIIASLVTPRRPIYGRLHVHILRTITPMKSLLLTSFLVPALAQNLELLKLTGPPDLPDTASHELHPALASFSIETAFFISYLGNTTVPNQLTLDLLKNLKERTGVAPEIRIGGITADSTYWDKSLDVAIFNAIDSSGALQNTTIGPAFFDAISLLPDDTKITMNLDLQDKVYNGALDVARATWEGLGSDKVVAFELGNEPDHYGFTPKTYASIWKEWSRNMTSALSLPSPFFQIAATAEDPLWPYDAPGASKQLDCVSALAAGANEFGTVNYCSEHTYQYSVCDPPRQVVATLPNLVNHTRLAMYLDLWQPRIQSVRSQLGPHSFVIGEYNSVSCSGKNNISNTFGQALWLLDTTLYAASLNVSRLYIHQGGPLALQSNVQLNHGGLSFYNLWYPIDNINGNITVFPSYSAYLFLAEAIGRSETLKVANIYPGRQANLSSITTEMGDTSAGQLVAYGFWDTSLPQSKPTKLALLNMQIFNKTQAESGIMRPNSTFDISDYLSQDTSGQIQSVRVRRLQAPGADIKDGRSTTWAGQTFLSGKGAGEIREERISGGLVTVQASEAALVFL